MLKFKSLTFFLKALFCVVGLFTFASFYYSVSKNEKYFKYYESSLKKFQNEAEALNAFLGSKSQFLSSEKEECRFRLDSLRLHLMEIDFWIRYYEPVAYLKINGALLVEYETEVFEKFEAPYRRDGSGLLLMSKYMESGHPNVDSLKGMLQSCLDLNQYYLSDSMISIVQNYSTFYFANRLFLLNLASVYTTGIASPRTELILPELFQLLSSVDNIYKAYNASSNFKLSSDYLRLFRSMREYMFTYKGEWKDFDHYYFIRNFVNPLFKINQELIKKYKLHSVGVQDYSLQQNAKSIFEKGLFEAQNEKGVYGGIQNERLLAEIKGVGKLLFYDPILSMNGKRSCASCHKPLQYFTDTLVSRPMHINGIQKLDRNAPSLVNVVYNHLLMLDGKHISLFNQTRDVLTNPTEMGNHLDSMLRNILECEEYLWAFKKFLKFTPYYSEITVEHILSAISLYYSEFSHYSSPFDLAMNGKGEVSNEAKQGFNIFMGKATCGTCHFAPMFNGVKPPYTNSEFEVIGVPSDTFFSNVSSDKGRYNIHPVSEMKHAFRTTTLRNISRTKPYMHNGVFNSLDEVMEFYNSGGGMGKGLNIKNQSLAPDSLRLNELEKRNLIVFLHSLDEEIRLENPPKSLPKSKNLKFMNRIIGGEY